MKYRFVRDFRHIYLCFQKNTYIFFKNFYCFNRLFFRWLKQFLSSLLITSMKKSC